MDLDVLVSTMYDKEDLYKKMNLQGSAIIVNQGYCEGSKRIKLKDGHTLKFISSRDRGLSKSRNLAIKNSTADICLFSDNDVTFENNYIDTVHRGYEQYPDADIIAFTVNSESSDRSVNRLKSGRVNRIMSMKISSVQISFKRKIIEENNLYLNENFGAGSAIFNSGEENIFLYKAIAKGLKVYYVDEKIAQVSFEDSTWYGKNLEQDLLTKGAIFYNMSPILYPFYNIQFILRKFSKYRKKFTFLNMIKTIFRGSKKGRNLEDKN